MRALARYLFSAVVVFCACALPALAQSAISARSGMIHYLEGRVYLGDQAVESKFGSFPEIKENMQLRTEEGRAEVLLTPGVFLRVAENSAIKMISTRLTDSRVDFVSGSALIESDDLLKDNQVTILYKDATAHLRKNGIYRFDSEPAQLRVYSGEADVETGGNIVIVKEGRLLPLDGGQAAEKFDNKLGDALNRWSQRRAEYLSMANVSAAKSVRDSGSSWDRSGWYWNPYFGMFTFIPSRGSIYSPYGYRYWNPGDVIEVYRPRVTASAYNGGYGMGASSYGTVPHTSGGYSGVVSAAPSASAPSTSAAGAASAPVSRGSGHAGGRSR